MSEGQERRRLRADRDALAAAEAARARRSRRLWQLGATLLAAAALVAAAVAISSSGGHKPTPPAASRALLAGIPQHGIELGDPQAAATLIEFADLQCPFCREYTVSAFPAVVARYVRTGRIKVVFRNLAFLGSDSLKAARFAAGAGMQDRLWNVVERMYQEQGDENSGYVTKGFLERIAREVPGLDLRRALSAPRALVDSQLAQAKALAKQLGVSSAPSFFVKRGAGRPRPLEVSDYSAGAFRSAIDRALASP